MKAPTIFVAIASYTVSADTCNRAATVVVVVALLWAVGTLWVIGALRGAIDDIDRDKEEDA